MEETNLKVKGMSNVFSWLQYQKALGETIYELCSNRAPGSVPIRSIKQLGALVQDHAQAIEDKLFQIFPNMNEMLLAAQQMANPSAKAAPRGRPRKTKKARA